VALGHIAKIKGMANLAKIEKVYIRLYLETHSHAGILYRE